MVALIGDPASLVAPAERTEKLLGKVAMVRFLGNPTFANAFLEILPVETDKWRALERLANEKGLCAEQIVAIDDASNDTEMIAQSGLGIAMGNAGESIKRAADVVTESNSESGVARAIERYLLA